MSLRIPSSSRSPDHVPHRTIYCAYDVHPNAPSRRVPDHSVVCRDYPSCGRNGYTSTTPRVRVPRHVARLVTRLAAPLVFDYFAYFVRPGASARRAARRAACCRLLRLRRAPGCLGTSRGLSRGSSSTTSSTPRVRVPRHIARLVTRLVVDYFDYAAHPGASARRVARRRLLRLRTSGCLGTSRGSSSTTSPTSCVRVPPHVARLVACLIVDYFAYATRLGASARRVVHLTTCFRLIRLRRASGCLGTLHASSRGSSRRSSSTNSPTSRVWVPRHFARLVVDYFAYATRPGAPRHVARLVTRLVVDYFDYAARPGAPRHVERLVTRLVVDYFDYPVRRGASTRRAARHAARRAARRRLLCVRRVSGCLGTSRSSSRGSSSTTSTTPRVRVPRHVARLITRLVVPLVIDYFSYVARPGALAHRAARHAARRAACLRLLRLRRTSGCLGTSRGPSRGSSLTTPCAAISSCSHTGSTSATPCVVTTCLTATLALLRVRRALPRRRLPIASRRPFIWTSFPN
jgi:hypothetical protein